jgi:2-polyprenyl-6-methoxyphenol hydroxylase-like FAD-dependent oxidoreductase
MSGAADLPRFIAACLKTGASPAWFATARIAGPLATFDASDSWVDHPHRDGTALIGDAASTSDPHWGQGMSHALRDVRLLSEALAASDDWDAAGHAYAAAHDRTCEVTRLSESWVTTMLMDVGPESDRVRERALPLLAQDPSRFPDFAFSGPDGEVDDEVRQRFFGES